MTAKWIAMGLAISMFVSPVVDARAVEVGLAAFDANGHLPSPQDILKLERSVGRRLDTVNWFMGFNAETGELPAFPLEELQAKIRPGIVPMLTLEPWGSPSDAAGQAVDPLRKITDGSIDDYLRQFARAVKAYGRPIRLRFGHEMIQDDDPKTGFPKPQWYPWQDYPESYKAAYRRLHRLFKEEGATNAVFVWSPNFEPFYQNVLEKYYPGPDYVDWIGIDGYNWANGDFDSVFKKIYTNIVGHPEVYGDKPVMLSEVGAGKDEASSKPFNKAAWIAQAFEKITHEYPKIRAVYWFNVKKERDWRLDESAESLEAFKAALKTIEPVDGH